MATLIINRLDEMRVMIYSAGWQMLEERTDTGWSSGFTADKTYQTIYGLRYIDDVVCRRLDHDNDGDYTEAGSGIYYHLTDSQFSTVAILDQNSGLLERVTYDPYGRPRQRGLDSDASRANRSASRNRFCSGCSERAHSPSRVGPILTLCSALLQPVRRSSGIRP